MNNTVFIIGAGPCGLTAAAFLTHCGIQCRIVDKKKGPTLTSNAVGIQARTLELLNEIELSNQFIAEGRICNKIDIFHSKKKLTVINLKKNMQSRYNFICMVPQNQTEKILLNYLSQHNIHVEYNTEVTSIKKMKELFAIEFNNTKDTTHYNWVIGADGYHSTVRNNSNIDYEGGEYPYSFIMIDASVSHNEQLLERMVVAAGNKINLLIFPMKKTCRFIAEVSQSEHYQVEPDHHVFNKLAQELIPYKINIHPACWHSKFYVHERLASTFNKDNIFLIGDAAHVHIPAGAQGMNTGIQDAINLAWKLSRVIKKTSNKNLLDSYNEERRPIAKKVLQLTNRMGSTLLSSQLFIRRLVTIIVPVIMKFKKFQIQFVNTLGETNINYRKTSRSKGIKKNGFVAGNRVWLSPSHKLKDHYLVIDYIGNLPKIWQETYSIILLNANKNNIDQLPKLDACYCIIRPDQYIGYIGNNATEVEEYIKS